MARPRKVSVKSSGGSRRFPRPGGGKRQPMGKCSYGPRKGGSAGGAFGRNPGHP